MKSVVPIIEEDESTRRTVIETIETKESDSRKSMGSSGKRTDFSDVLESLLESNRRLMTHS